MGLVGRRWGRVGWWQGGGERGGDRLAGVRDGAEAHREALEAFGVLGADGLYDRA